MDAIKHIDYFFMRNFIRDVKEKQGQDFYVFGEFWNAKEGGIIILLSRKTENRFDDLWMFAFITIYMMPASKE